MFYLEVLLGLVAFSSAIAWVTLHFFCHSREWRAMERRGREYLRAQKRQDVRMMVILDRRRSKTEDEITKPNPTRKTP